LECFQFHKKFRNFSGTNGTEISWDRLKIAEFPRSENKIKLNESFKEKFFENLGILLLLEIMHIIHNFLFSASSFGHNHNKLDIWGKDDGYAYSKMD